MGTSKHGHCLTGHHRDCRKTLDNGHVCSCECHETEGST